MIQDIKDILGVSEDLANVNITPDMARRLLVYNTNNRKISDATVNKYAKCMENGEWFSDASMITFSSKGELTNGQHRLQAIIKSNTPVKFVVRLGVDNFNQMDRGKSRTVIDNLMLDDRFRDTELAKTKEIPSMASVMYRAVTGVATTDVNAVASILEKYGDDLVFLRDEGILFGSKKINKKQISCAMLTAYVNGVNIELLRRVRNVLNTGICSGAEDSPIIALRDLALKTKGSGIGVDKELYRCSLYCIYACERGIKRKVCKAADPKYSISWE